MAQTILVTGATGFLGSAVMRRLVKGVDEETLFFSDGTRVERVIALNRHSTSLERLEELTGLPHWSVERADIADPHGFRTALAETQPRVIMHLALDPVVYTDISESEIQRLNEIPLESMFEYLSSNPNARLINTGSAWVLGSGHGLAEYAAIEPQSPYARAKYRIDKLLPVLQSRYGVDWINLRIFNVYGRYESRSRLLPYLVSTLPFGKPARLSHGNQVRDFNDVDDIAEAYVLALQADSSACCQTYHIGTGHGLTTRGFAGTVARVTGHADLIEFGAIDSPDQQIDKLVANPALAQEKLGWTPPSRPEERIKQAALWWLKMITRS